MPNTVISVKFVDRYYFLWLEEKSYFSCVCKFEDPLLSTVSTCIGWWFSPNNPVSSTNKTDCHNIAEILLKVALNTINPNLILVVW
jgi:hypothetical protein